MADKASVNEVAKATNNLLHYCEEDQQPLLSVIHDYFDNTECKYTSNDEDE